MEDKFDGFDSYSLHTFPFEGNWNIHNTQGMVVVLQPASLHTFPFEGNGNTRAQSARPLKISSCLATHFPVWRELKLNSFTDCLSMSIGSLHTFPFEGNGNNLTLSASISMGTSRYTLSRLKGIETLSDGISIEPTYSEVSLHTFPFEGNWNLLWWWLFHQTMRLATHFPVWRELKLVVRSNIRTASFRSLHTFPFEGNWNDYEKRKRHLCQQHCSLHTFPFEGNWNFGAHHKHPPYIARYTLSRLKGMETIMCRKWICGWMSSLHTFPFEGNWNAIAERQTAFAGRLSRYTLSRLKGIETICVFTKTGLMVTRYTLSRLKGMETFPFRCHFCPCGFSLHTFPFEGNWNSVALIKNSSRHYVRCLATHFPGWRELKRVRVMLSINSFLPRYTLSRLKGIETLSTARRAIRWFSRYTLSRLKGIETMCASFAPAWGFFSLHTFPFEGNWNTRGMPARPAKRNWRTRYTLSRLKGMET